MRIEMMWLNFMKKLSRIILTACLLVCMVISSAYAAGGSAATDWENDIITATGYGAPSDRAKNPGHKKILAHQAAMLDGYRRLAEQAKGIHITADSSIADNVSTGDIVTGAVDAVIKRAKVVSESYDEYGNCSLTMEVPLYGVSNSIARMALKPVEQEAFPAPSVNTDITVTANYTGLIVDCRGMGLKPTMSPVIFNTSQQAIYGYKNLAYDNVVASGMASYVVSMNGNVSRAGSNPLIVKAVRLERNNSYPVVSVADADRILLENQKSHILDRCAVVFIY